jgi:3-oxoacyl-[acyl-carrier protein] reductase
VIYGGAGKVGGAVARASAREGATVFLAGRTIESLEEIRSAGGVVETAQVDALDEQAVEGYVEAVAEKAGGVDISFDLISVGDVQGTRRWWRCPSKTLSGLS